MKQKDIYAEYSAEFKERRNRWLMGFIRDILIGFLIGSIIIFMISFAGCSGNGDDDNIIPNPNPSIQEIPPLPDPPELAGKVQLALITGSEIKFFDGEQIWMHIENGKRVQNGVYTSVENNAIYKLDEYAYTEQSRLLPLNPDVINIKNYPVSKSREIIGEFELENSDIWIVEYIDPETAYSMGALYADYSRIYKNSVEYGNWYENQYTIDKLIVLENDIYARLNTGGFLNVNGDKENVRLVVEDGFAIYDYDSGNRTATISGIPVLWTTNFFNGANYWLKSSNKWYSQNGYIWDGSILDEDTSVLSDFRSIQNIIISVGKRNENEEDVLYFVNCATGYVIRYVPSTNSYIEYVRLYDGDGSTETGIFYRATLSPIINNNYLYFINEANVYRYSFETGLITWFADSISEIYEF